jgi:hypothetical protein
VRAAALEQLRTTRSRVSRWRLRDSDRKTARQGLRRIYRDGQRRRRVARKAGSSQALHAWRKRVKDLRYLAEALKLRDLASDADRLGETLGEEHDLALLAECLRTHRDCFKGERATRKTLQKLIARRRERLRRRAMRLGKRLYRHKPKRFTRRRLDS